VRLVVADEEVEAAAIREVDLQWKYHWSPSELATKLKLTGPRALALRRYLKIDDDPACRHTFVFVRRSTSASPTTRTRGCATHSRRSTRPRFGRTSVPGNAGLATSPTRQRGPHVGDIMCGCSSPWRARHDRPQLAGARPRYAARLDPWHVGRIEACRAGRSRGGLWVSQWRRRVCRPMPAGRASRNPAWFA